MPRNSHLASAILSLHVVEVLTPENRLLVPVETRCNDCLLVAVTMCLRARAAETVSLIHFGC